MGITLKTHKILWARSGGKCAICKQALVIDSSYQNDDLSVVGDEAHIIAKSETFTRGEYDSLSPKARDHYSNLILLCKIHHKQIDDQPTRFTVETLREIKKKHEMEIEQLQTAEDKRKQNDDLIYSEYIDEWARKSKLTAWRSISSYISFDTPSLPKTWYETQHKLIIWIIARIWPKRYPALENAIHNYMAVLQDFLDIFDQHASHKINQRRTMRTTKFYQIDEWDPPRYQRLLTEYKDHVRLVNDLFFELTRAANYVCDKVREDLFEGYRVAEGALLVTRHGVGVDLKSTVLRLEYRNTERTERPYPGLKKFLKVRYTTRDCALDPYDRWH